MAEATDFLSALPVEKPLNYSTYTPKPFARAIIVGYGSGDSSLSIKEWIEETETHQKKGDKVNSMQGVFLLARYPRGMFPKRKEGEENKASRPLCTSIDGVWGDPTPKAQMMGVTGYCATCAEAEFGGLCRGTSNVFLLRETDGKVVEVSVSQTNLSTFLDFLEAEGGEEEVRRKLVEIKIEDLDDERKTARMLWSVVRDGEYEQGALAAAGEALQPFLKASERPNLIPRTEREDSALIPDQVNPNPIDWGKLKNKKESDDSDD